MGCGSVLRSINRHLPTALLPIVNTRFRITFAKTNAMRYTSHLDLQRTWERTFRRAKLPLVYSQGYTPHARLQLAAALPLGFTSNCEVLDAWLQEKLITTHLESGLENSLPPGLLIHDIYEVDLQAPPIQTQLISAEYTISFLEPVNNLYERATNLLQSTNITRLKRGKSYDLRPLIIAIDHPQPDQSGNQLMVVHLTAQEGRTGRPDEVLDAMSVPIEATSICRTKLIFTGE